MINYKIENSEVVYRIRCTQQVQNAFPSIRKIKNGNRSDLMYKLNGVYEILKNENIASYLEPMAGAGFSSALVQHMHSPELYLNDINPHCVENLQHNFESDIITEYDYTSEKYYFNIPTVDCCFFDHSHFTFNRETKWLYEFALHSEKIFIYTDVFAFSLKPFDIEKYIKYLRRSNTHLKKIGLFIKNVYIYPSKNAAVVGASPNPKNKINTIEGTDKFQIIKMDNLSLNL